MQTPDKLLIFLWTFFAISINTVSIFIVFYECAFRLTAFEESNSIVLATEFILFIDIFSYFFKAFPKKDSPRGFLCSLLGMCGLCKKTCRKKEESWKLENEVREN